MDEIFAFIKKAREEERKLQTQYYFVIKHKFEHEAEYLRTKLDLLGVVIAELELVAKGKQKGDDAHISFS